MVSLSASATRSPRLPNLVPCTSSPVLLLHSFSVETSSYVRSVNEELGVKS